MSGCGTPPDGKIGIRHGRRSARWLARSAACESLLSAIFLLMLPRGFRRVVEPGQASKVRHDRADTIGRETRCSNSLCTTPWSAIQRFRRVPREWTEDICAENNFDFLQYDVVPLPHADAPDF
jgi:hypothetical protein